MMDSGFKRRVAEGARNLMFEGYEKGAADMRERAAQLVDYYIARSEDGWVYPTARETVYAIRALPLN